MPEIRKGDSSGAQFAPTPFLYVSPAGTRGTAPGREPNVVVNDVAGSVRGVLTDVATAAGASLLVSMMPLPAILGPMAWAAFRGATGAAFKKPGASEPLPPSGAGADADWEALAALQDAGFISFLSLAQARAEDLRFPPGHPLPGRCYRAHPLRDKERQYVPAIGYDDLLYQERESELIRLLTELGATQIQIVEKEAWQAQGKASGGVDAGPAAQATAEVRGGQSSSNAFTRQYELEGADWATTEALRESEFRWLEFEPQWRAMVHARLRGRCRRAVIEMSQSASFSLGAEMRASGALLASAGVPGLSAELEGSSSKDRTYRFEVQFVQVAPK